MIDSHALAKDASAAHTRLAKDIAARAKTTPELADVISTEYQRALDAERTQLAESQFTGALIDQAAQSWVLSLILVRFLEDTGLIEAPLVSGPGSADRRARDALTLHFRAHPEHSEREYLEHCFRSLSTLPGLHELFGPEQWQNEPDAQGTRFGDFAQSFLRDRTARAGLSVEGLGAWRPQKK